MGGTTGFRAITFCVLVAIALASQSADKVSFEIQDSHSHFRSTERARQAAVDAATQLVGIAQTRFGITLDGSDLSVIELQKLAEQVRNEYLAISDVAEQKRQKDEWVRLFGGYFGELLVKNHGAVWGKTDWLGGDEQALGYPKSRGVSLPYNQVIKAFNSPSSICGWYIIATSGMEGGDLPSAISECDARGFKKTAEEEERSAKVAAFLKQRDEDELKQRVTQRTMTEASRAVYKVQLPAMDAFRAHKVKAPARFSFGFTVSPDGVVTEAHKLSSDFENPALEQELLDLVRGMKFEARAVPEYVCPGLVLVYRKD